MSIPITIPRLGWNMEQGTFVEWLKADGDPVKPGDVLYRLEGEKSVEEIEAFDAGVLHIPADAPKPGDSVSVGATLGYLLQPGETPSHPVDSLAATRAVRLAARHNLDWQQLRGSGQSGRIRERDVEAALPARSASKVPAVPLLAPRAGDMRTAIAARMLASHLATAPVTLTSLVDASNLVNLREQFKATDPSAIPSYTDFLVKFAARALHQHPMLAARWTDDGIQLAERIDIGIAVDTEAGLLVPVLRDVPALGLRQVATQSRELIDRARQGRLAARDMAGGCFTITNLGAFGIDAFTPIINAPECAILGVGRIERRPAMDGDRVVGREQVALSLTFDHRIVDGAPAARFLQTLAQMIANPGPWVST